MQKSFRESAGYLQLSQLAEKPVDLTDPSLLTQERIKSLAVEACGYKLLYATERVNAEVMDALASLAEERSASTMMEKMQSGEVINCIEGFASENRAVLHTSLRDFFEDRQTSKPAKEAADLALIEVERLKSFLVSVEKEFTTLVVIGIGGSELGPKALYLALEAYKIPGKRVEFIGNIDPDDTVKVLRSCDLKKTLVCVISKSGTTQETCVNEQFARSLFEKEGLSPKDHFLAVTGEGSPLDDLKKYRSVFHIWDWIGGRYSASSIIGGVIIGFSCGIGVYWELLEGAHAMDQHALKEKKPLHNLPLVAALLGIWNHNFLNIQTTAIIPYSQALWRFTAHLQQLDMESNGKQVDRSGRFLDFKTGPIIWGEAGTNAQHSFFQLIHQGTLPIAIEFIGYEKCQTGVDFVWEDTTSQQKLLANLFAQATALAQGQQSDNPNKRFFGNRPSSILLGYQLTPGMLGALLAFYEHKVAFQGFIWNINSFDQEGVQLGKILAGRILEGFKKKGLYPLADSWIGML